MKSSITSLFLCIAITFTYPCFSQCADSLNTSNSSSLRPTIDWSKPPVSQSFEYKPFILPAALVTYGVIAINNKSLWGLNEKIKEEVYTERASANKIHLDNYLQFGPAVAVYGLNAAGISGKNNFRDRSILYGLSELIMGSTVFTVKKIAGETRPDGTDRYSFPSGHTASAFAAAEFMHQEYKDQSPLYSVAGYAMAAATGYLRMYNNKHWMGDVVAGAGIGIMSTKLAYWVYPAIKRKLFKNKEVSTIVMPSYQNGSVGVGLVHRFR